MTRRWWSALAAVAAVALALRVAAISFGLPSVYNPDEVAIMSRALAFAKGDLNPHNFVYPTFYFYVLFMWVGASFVWQRFAGAVSSAREFQARFFVDPTSIYLAGRALSAIAGALTTTLVALLGRTVFDRTTGLVAAGLMALLPLAVQDAHYVKHDVPVTLLTTAALWLMARCWPEGGAKTPAPLRDLALAAMAAGVAWSTHYYSVFLAVPLALSVWVGRRSQGWVDIVRTAATAGTLATVVFFALSPFLLVEPQRALRDIVANRQIVVDRAAELGFGANLVKYAELLVSPGATLGVVVLAAAGAVLLLRRQPRLALLLLSFPVTFALFIANTVPASRYLNPVLPVVALLAAHAAVAACRLSRHPRLVATAMALALLPSATARSVEVGRFFAQPDTRTLARGVIEATAPSGSTILIQPYSVQLFESREGLVAALMARAGSLEAISTRSKLRLATSPWPQPAYRLLWLGEGGLDDDKIYVAPGDLRADPIASLRALGVGFVVLKRFDVPDPNVAWLADALATRGRLVASIVPYRSRLPSAPSAPFLHNTDALITADLARPGPIVDIFAVPEAGSETLQ